MSNAPRIETEDVAYIVEGYVDTELSNAAKFDNCTPLDESGIYNLHLLAAQVYALGFDAGERVADARRRGRESRQRQAVE
jgi:hypothetical protein